MSFEALVDSDVGVDVTILTPGTTDDGYGGERDDWSDPDEQTVRGKFTQASTDRDRTGNRDATVDTDTLHLPSSAVVTERCRFVIGDDTWECDGAPYLAPRGLLWRIEVRRVQG